MFRRNACWFIRIFVAVVICSGYSHPFSVTESYTEVSGHSVTADNSESLTVGLVQEAEEATAVDLGALLDAGDDAVVTLLAGDTRLVAHRAVLAARSPVFADMFRRVTVEGSSSQLVLSDTEGPVLRQVLAYLYTLQVPQLPSMAPKLLVAADVYGLSVLKAHCEQQVVAQLSVETAAAAGVIAIRHSANRLKQAAVAFIKAHLLRVMATQGWAEAVVNDPQTVVKLAHLIAETPTDTRNLSGEEKGKMLVAAAKEGSVSKVRTLLAVGTDVEAMDENQQNALHWAAAGGHAEVVRRLLEEGADVNARDRWRNTPLHQAAWNDNATVVRLLAASSADCNARDHTGNTPLHDAARRGQADAATALLEAGADREVRNYDGDTPLDLAEWNNHEWLIDILGSS
ncbi:serine/threonine-protein phosphatase 6 regulatory ankyrin repeat subunit B-like isoform X3 [Schistocerca serialis cubense]|uniref:serine/threonine-protein phosphatase 6 regulatory ankyrin repeat subunit B-like isoform X3 n=1 Tax=Schistocerca serialis cubense TaxID=2023355 RepID=UPI00214EA74E|nr:serine/threonine-protein phosphatase 6 regulatory ankyrin repeat subunit B-like isoform X3 [Schistocerca serialis cubense]